MNRHFVRYVIDSSPVNKIFSGKNRNKNLEKFIKDFEKAYAGKMMDGYWLDLVVRDIAGKIEQYE